MRRLRLGLAAVLIALGLSACHLHTSGSSYGDCGYGYHHHTVIHV